MAVKPLQAVSKEEFVAGPAKKVLNSPRGPKAKKLSEPQATTFKALLFGPTGSGKTYAIKGLLEHGFKVLVISTDMGGDGLVTVKTALRMDGHAELLENCTSIVLTNYDEVIAFLNRPEDIYPEIYTDSPDWLVWDGFSSFQQTLLSDKIGEMEPARQEGKEVSDARDSGLQLELQDWGMVRNGTIRNLDKFLKLHNRKTGQVWHKIVTCLEGIKTVRSGSGINSTTTYTDAKEPMLQGSAAKLIGPAFDLILNTRIMAGAKEDEKRAFKYVCAGHDSLAGPKTRGIILNPIEPADFFDLWDKIASQLQINRGQIDENIVEKSIVLEGAPAAS